MTSGLSASPKKDVVYTVKIDPEKLSTKFQDWIEKDLLKI